MEILSEQNNTNHGGAGRIFFIFLTIGLLAIIIGGLFWIFALSPASPVGLGWFLFSFASGLSMIVLPCTLPLAFVIVPLVMGKGYAKGLATALSFSLGVAITLSMYGILAAILGKAIFAFSGGSGEIIKNVFYAIAGVFAIVFALGELGLLKVRMPSFGGAVPGFIQNRQDILRPFLMGLFLGNIGVGCPHPATPIILGQIGIVGDVFYGWLLFFVHALGRILPLIVLAMFGIIGINATKALVSRREQIAKITAWGMIFVGGFLFTLGFFGHNWWVYSGQHSLFEVVTQEERFTSLLSERLAVAPPHRHGLEELEGKTGFFGAPLWLGNWALVALWVLPMLFWWLLSRRNSSFIVTFSLLLGLLFIQVIPHWFLAHKALELETETVPKVQTIFSVVPSSPAPGIPAFLIFSLKDEQGSPLKNIKIAHERILHIQVVSEDFNVFSHIHPEDFGTITRAATDSAEFSVPYNFPKSGRYLIAADYAHDTHEISSTFIHDIGERGIPVLLKDFTRQKNFNGYDVSLDSSPLSLIAGQEVVLTYSIAKDGAAVSANELEAYLAEPMHLSIVSIDLSGFQHTHGEIHDNTLESHILFPFPGIYQIFGEFKHQGQVIVTSFMVEVGAADGSSASAPRYNSHD